MQKNEDTLSQRPVIERAASTHRNYAMGYTIVDKVGRFLTVTEDVGRIVTIVSMTALVFLQVMLRVFFRWSSPAWEEAARFLMIWSIFIGTIVTTREDRHIRMKGFFGSGSKQLWFELIAKIVCFLFICVFVKWSYEFAVHSIEKSMTSIVLGMPLIVVHSSFFLCGVFTAFHFLIHIINRVREITIYYRGDR